MTWNTVDAHAPSGEMYLRAAYKIRKHPIDIEGLRLHPPAGWRPSHGLPIGPTPKGGGKYLGRFEPTRVFQNASIICNYAATHPRRRRKSKPLIGQIVRLIRKNSFKHKGARFIFRDYDLKRMSHVMRSGWVNSMGNAFAILTLLRIQELYPSPRIAKTLDELARAYMVVNTREKRRERPWFSYIDDADCLWFDEYPADDGTPTLVLNGHIFATFAILSYAWARPELRWPMEFAQGGVATVRMNVARFRRRDRISLYSLRGGEEREDYRPIRTIRQQKQLYWITRDPYFRRMRRVFQRDFATSKRLVCRVPDLPIRSVNDSA